MGRERRSEMGKKTHETWKQKWAVSIREERQNRGNAGNNHHDVRQCTKKPWCANISVLHWCWVLWFKTQEWCSRGISSRFRYPRNLHTDGHQQGTQEPLVFTKVVGVYFLNDWVSHPLKAEQQENWLLVLFWFLIVNNSVCWYISVVPATWETKVWTLFGP